MWKNYFIAAENFLRRNSISAQIQFGFRKNRSTTDAIRKIMENINCDNFDQITINQCIFLDFSNVFDHIDHHILVAKPKLYHFDDLLGTSQNRKSVIKNDKIPIGVLQESMRSHLFFYCILLICWKQHQTKLHFFRWYKCS